MLLEKKEHLTTLASKDFDLNTITLDKWEVSEMITIGRNAKIKFYKIGEDFLFTDLDNKYFDNFKFSTD